MNVLRKRRIRFNNLSLSIVQQGINNLDIKVDILLQGTSFSKPNHEASC
jgi:hypothetical protein